RWNCWSRDARSRQKLRERFPGWPSEDLSDKADEVLYPHRREDFDQLHFALDRLEGVGRADGQDANVAGPDLVALVLDMDIHAPLEHDHGLLGIIMLVARRRGGMDDADAVDTGLQPGRRLAEI